MGPRVISKISHFDFNREFLYGDERMGFIIIRDSTASRGFKLFKTLLNSVYISGTNVAFVCFDGPIEHVAHGLEINVNETLIFDEFNNSAIWNNEVLLDDNCLEELSRFEGFLCIYSLTSLIVQKGADRIYRIFHKLLSNNPKLQILSLLHTDVHATKDNEILDNLATAIINTNPADETKFLLTMSTRNKSFGQMWYEYQISSKFTFDKIVSVPTKCIKILSKKPDPTANLTFNLNLNDDEKEARSQLQMPFAKTQTSDGMTTQDLEDDLFEEEDPDDDLGFLEAI